MPPADQTSAATPPPTRPSPAATAAGLIALGTLYAVIGGHWLIPVLAVALLGPQFTAARLESRSPLRWLIRIALYGLVMLVTQGEPNNSDSLIGSAGFRSQVGLLYAAEMAVQAWRQRGDSGHASLTVLFTSGLVYLTACNTFEDRFVWLVTPAYAVCAVAAMLGHRRRVFAAAPGTRAALFMRAAAVALVLGIGLVSVRGVRVYKGELNDLGNRLIGDQGWFESSGMSSQPRLGSTFDLRGSPERVLRVRDLGDDAHLRGASFDTYEGGRWGPSAAPGQRQYRKVTLNELSLPAQGGLSVTASVRGRQDMVITRLVSDNRLVFAPLGAVSLDPGEADDVEWSPENGGPIRTRARPPYEYTVTVGSDERYQGPQATPIVPRSGKARDRLLQMPDGPDMAYIRNLSAEIVRRAGARTSEAKAEAVVRYLLANHQYSLSTQVGPGDPVASFLRDKKSAHCEFFAASAALLLRAAGVPTRYVQGYYAHEAAGEGVTIVRQRDAHAWTEVWLDGVGWVWIDATPGDGRPDNDPERIAPWRRASEWLQDHIQGLRDLLADLPPEVLNAIVAVIALLPLGYFVLRTQLAKRRRRGDAGESSGDYTAPPGDLPEAAARFEAALARAGAPAPAERTWAEHLGNVPAALAEAAAPFVRAYDAARFGGRYDAETAARLGRLLDGVERAAVPADNAQRGDSKTTA